MPELPFNIVAIDGFGRDYNGGKSEWLVGTAYDEKAANMFAMAWNDREGEDAPEFAVVRPASEPLYQFIGY